MVLCCSLSLDHKMEDPSQGVKRKDEGQDITQEGGFYIVASI